MWYTHSYSMFGPQLWSPFGFGIFGSFFFIIAALWLLFTIVLKGYALWHAAKRGQIWWFVALMIFNTLGILELIYIVFFLKKWPGKADETQHSHVTHHEHHDGPAHNHDHTHHTV